MRGAGGGRLPLTLFTGEQWRVAHTALGVQVDFVSCLHPVLLDGAMPRAELVVSSTSSSWGHPLFSCRRWPIGVRRVPASVLLPCVVPARLGVSSPSARQKHAL